MYDHVVNEKTHTRRVKLSWTIKGQKHTTVGPFAFLGFVRIHLHLNPLQNISQYLELCSMQHPDPSLRYSSHRGLAELPEVDHITQGNYKIYSTDLVKGLSLSEGS